MNRKYLIILIIMMAANGYFGARLVVDSKNNTEYIAINKLIKHCTSPVQNELVDGLYRYQCDAGYYISRLSPEKFQELKENK